MATIWTIVLVIVAFVWLLSTIKEGFKQQTLLITILKRELEDLRKKLETSTLQAKVTQQSPVASPIVTEPEHTKVPEATKVEPVAETATPPSRPLLVAEKSEFIKQKPIETPHVQPQQPPKAPQPTFFERYPDVEKFIGENLINKIGIAIFVLGIGFFVKFAIDKNWINEIGRMSIGILAGGALIAIAHKLRKTLTAFSSVLIGGGLSVLYFSIGIGFHDYQLLSQTAAFAIMVMITTFAVALSLLYNRKELAVIALIGGFGTPFFISTGEGNYVILFTYLLILNVGMTVLSVQKKWGIVNLLSYLFTLLIYGGWLGSKINGTDVPYGGALVFGALFYLLFFAMNVGYNIKNKQPFKPIDIGILISNSFFFFVAGMICLKHIHGGDFRGLFTVGMGLFNFVFARLIYHNNAIDRNLFYLLIGLVLTFISLAAPIQLKGNYITLFWAAESVLLLWLSQKSGIELIKKASLVVTTLMCISLLMDWQLLYGFEQTLPIVINKAFITSLSAFAAMMIYTYLLRAEKTSYYLLDWAWPVKTVKTVFAVVGIVVLYFGIHLEIDFQVNNIANYHKANMAVLACYNMVFGAILVAILRKKQNPAFHYVAIAIGAVLMMLYITIFNSAIVNVRQLTIENTHLQSWIFLLHPVTAAAFATLLFLLKPITLQTMQLHYKKTSLVYWLFIFGLVYTLSAELDHFLMWHIFQYNEFPYYQLEQNHKFGYLILWALVSFALIIIGMKKKQRIYRIISLSLFALIIGKLFLIDIWSISRLGKILAFVSLGALLLVVSFLYNRLKVLMANDNTPGATTNEPINTSTGQY